MYLAATVTTLDKLKQVPPQFWIMILAIVGGVIVGVVVLRHVVKMNKILLTIFTAAVLVIVGFNWVYKRNEPKFMSPLVDKIAPFLPSAVNYDSKQSTGH